jgi:hypothetical protein
MRIIHNLATGGPHIEGIHPLSSNVAGKSTIEFDDSPSSQFPFKWGCLIATFDDTGGL